MALTKISSSVIAGNAVIAAGVAENAITASEIASNAVGTAQIASGSITNAMLDTNIDIAGTLDVTGVLTADSNVVIAGNLTVNGSTVTNSATNTTIEDLLIELGTGTTGSPSSDAGIVIERGDSDNAFIGWDESADSFIVGTGSFTGASTGNLSISTAPLTTGALTASGLSYPTSDGSAGNYLKTDGSGTLSFDSVTSVVDNYTTTGDGSTTAFDTGINPGNEVNTWVFIDGVYQQKSEYSYSGSTITFSTAPDNGATIDVTTGTVGGFASSDTVLGVYEATTTATDTYSTGISASNENNTWVFVGGVYQPKDTYTFSGGTLTFDANTPAGEKLSVIGTKTLTASAVTTSAIAANAVTSAKIASNSILSRHIANNSIVGADISATTQITASTFTGALTGNVTGNVTGNLNGLSYPSSDGTNGQVLTTNGSGTLSFSTISSTSIADADADTKIQVEESSDEDVIRFDVGGTEYMTLTSNGKLNVTEIAHISSGSLEIGNGDEKQIFDASGATIQFQTADTERMRIDSSGNVGIGNSTPSNNHANANRLVVGNGTAGGIANYVGTGTGWYAFSRDNANNTDAYDGGISYDGSRNLKFHTNAGSTRMTINGAGNVGIGTSNPDAPLHVEATNASMLLSNSGRTQYFRIQNNETNDALVFNANDTNERMRIDSNGALLVGLTSRSWSLANFEVVNNARIGNLYFTGSGSNAKITAGNGEINPGSAYWTGGATGLDINFNVVVTGVGITTSAKLDSPTGDWYTNDGTVSSLSDERVKTDITDLSDGLEIVKQLRPVTFKYNDNSQDDNGYKRMGGASDKVRYGFIAQEVEQVAPQYVETGIGYINNEEVNDFKSMSTTRMIPMLFKAIQEQQTIIDDLKSRIETLENN